MGKGKVGTGKYDKTVVFKATMMGSGSSFNMLWYVFWLVLNIQSVNGEVGAKLILHSVARAPVE